MVTNLRAVWMASMIYIYKTSDLKGGITQSQKLRSLDNLVHVFFGLFFVSWFL